MEIKAVDEKNGRRGQPGARYKMEYRAENRDKTSTIKRKRSRRRDNFEISSTSYVLYVLAHECRNC